VRTPFFYKDRVAQTRDKLKKGVFFVLKFRDWEQINYSVHRKNILDNNTFCKLPFRMSFGVKFTQT